MLLGTSTSSSAIMNNQVPKCCVLDSKGCLSLSSILASFTAAINEEQAWALTYQTLRCAQAILQDPSSRDSCTIACHSDHIKIHRDGSVHPDSYLDPGQGPPNRTKCSSECKIISKLGKIIFEALDYGLSEEDERQLSPELDELLDTMISADDSAERPETDDEGIERDSGDSDDDRLESTRGVNIDTLLGLCRERLGGGSGGNDAHYRAVCRALVAEALELSEFLEKVRQGTQQLRRPVGHHTGRNSASPNQLQPDPDLDQLHFSVWARLWVQVIQDLRTGVKLKKVECRESGCSSTIEYELTPYEILMDDIRSRRYKLKQVMVDGGLHQRIKKDAHAIILEFIRSRPPLKKVTDRKLAPPPAKKYDPVEALMDSIRKQHNLRPTQTKVPTSTFSKDSVRIRGTRRQSSYGEMSRSSSISEHSHRDSSTRVKSNSSSTKTSEAPQRRLIKPDFDLLYSLDKDDDSDDENGSSGANKLNDTTGSLYYGHICPDQTQSEPTTPWRSKPLVNGSKTAESGDDSCVPSRVDLRRRHTICSPRPTQGDDHSSTPVTFPFEYTNNLNAFHSLNGPSVSPVLHRRKTQLPRSMSKSLLQEEFFQSNHWQTAMESLSLNLEEVVHIRNVLTKAELEGLPVDCSTKDDVVKGKVCFLCLKSRFGFLLQRGSQCKLCTRMVCQKCCSKMRIPTDHFANIPVSTLSPLLSPRDEDYSLTPTKTLTPQRSPVHGPNRRKNSVGSAPTSPTLSRNSLGTDSDSGQRSISPALVDSSEERDRFSPDSGPYSLPSVSAISSGLLALKRRGFGNRRDSEKTERLRGALMVVCHDCKAMVLQIIRSSRVKKGNTVRSNMTLELPASTAIPQLAS